MNPEGDHVHNRNFETPNFGDKFKEWVSHVAYITDRYLRREDTSIARFLDKLCTYEGEEYLHSIHKRLLDLSIVVPTTIIVAPGVILLGAIKVLEDGGRMFYVHERVMPGTGDLFGVIKLRTMIPEADKEKHLVLADGYSEESDPRVTTYGRILRRFKLDELPQLLQVLTGKLSLIGTRALSQHVLDFLQEEWSPARFARWSELYNRQPRSGISGTNQTINTQPKNNLKIFRLEAFYIENASLGLDTYLMWRTFLCVMGVRPQKSRKYNNII
ncbi:MAG: sugar transferase [Patescibacteria group bacterium]|nr:sugar transferase [Patescibacteria group bacterium]